MEDHVGTDEERSYQDSRLRSRSE